MSAFWDASAVLHLCVRGQKSKFARELLTEHSPVIWWASPVEVQSALLRLERERLLTYAARQAVIGKLSHMMESWRQIQPDDGVRTLALELLERFPLKAADALQLAAAVTWAQRKPNGRLFVCNDRQLSHAAEQAGFEIASV